MSSKPITAKIRRTRPEIPLLSEISGCTLSTPIDLRTQNFPTGSLAQPRMVRTHHLCKFFPNHRKLSFSMKRCTYMLRSRSFHKWKNKKTGKNRGMISTDVTRMPSEPIRKARAILVSRTSSSIANVLSASVESRETYIALYANITHSFFPHTSNNVLEASIRILRALKPLPSGVI